MEFIYNLAKEYNLLLESVVYEFKPKELDKGTTFLKTKGKYIIS